MPIIVNIDVMLAKRKMTTTELAEKVGISLTNLSILKTNKAKAIRFSTLEALCKALDCQPGGIFWNIGQMIQIDPFKKAWDLR
jgi:putative transcriptional regulator